MTTEEAKKKILSCIINCEISLYTAMYTPDHAVVPISNILSLIDGLTKYRARLALKSLVDDGYIRYESQGCPAIESCGEYRELVWEAGPPINGYALTKQGFHSREWVEQYDEWNKSMEEWASGSVRYDN